MESTGKTQRVDEENFVTVVSVGAELDAPLPSSADLVLPVNANSAGFVTVLTIGDGDEDAIANGDLNDVIERVLVYRLPGERLGFGLKFEGGTKANEFVKRLFIQSCAPDSPASRVQSTWGDLTEGDEVLEIDSIPVNTMTRIDCVRCLKDSNVVIKLVVRHSYKNRPPEDVLPHVISAEKKRTPPPPPPVPPRKIPKKSYKKPIENPVENPVPAVRHNVTSESVMIKKKFQSPRSSGRSSYSPDIPRRDRRYSDGSLGPPNAQVYVDLFSQESTLSLSESDDTGSSISTIVDRFASYPTTTTSSLAGSLPSTPTSLQKHLDFSSLIYDDEDTSFKTKINTTSSSVKNYEILEKSSTIINNNNINNNSAEDGSGPLQPPSCFQDAPLSYGNEDMRLDSKGDVSEPLIVAGTNERKVVKKPPVPPRAKDLIRSELNGKEIHDENMNVSNLPRLVDFVPKARDNFDNPADLINEFLDNERRETDNCLGDSWIGDDFCNEIDLYSSKWSLSSQLATIGEVEEESTDFDYNRSTPIVIVENADSLGFSPETKSKSTKEGEAATHREFNGKMETLPSDSRQPPDGHEFPDYVESGPDFSQNSYRSSTHLNIEPLKMKPSYSVNSSLSPSSFSDFSSVPLQNSVLNKMNSVSNGDLSCIAKDDGSNDDEGESTAEPALHARSQSLIDVSAISKQQKNARWSLLVEQRRKGFAKLKGLVIPELVSETDASPAVSIPEIITAPIAVLESQVDAPYPDSLRHSAAIENVVVTSPAAYPSSAPTWASATLPKYSPAFKRKSLKICPQSNPSAVVVTSTPEKVKSRSDTDDSSDAPKSLESITSPTRSDCSFDYLISFRSKVTQDRTNKPESLSKLHKDSGRSEDESDNDSAVSSSQSSYKCSPPCSPTRSDDMLDYESTSRKSDDQDADKLSNLQSRLLKAASVEAINRKNILASAKCRSGRDFKVRSPVIQRKYDENEEKPSHVETPEESEQPIEEIAVPEKIEEKSPPPVVEKEPTKVPVQVKEKLPDKIALCSKPPPSPSPSKTDRPLALPLNNKSPAIPPVRTEFKLDSPRKTSLLRNEKSMSVTDLRKSFEKFGSTPPTPLPPQNQSLTLSKKRPEVKKIAPRANKVENCAQPEKKIDPTKTIVTKIEENVAKPSVVEAIQVGTNQRKIVLSPKFVGGSVGITLAGGTDYETREITVHKIRHGSVAQIDGQLKRGDRIISINGKSTAGRTHAESVEMLKEAVSQFILMVEDGKEEGATSPQRKSFPELKNSNSATLQPPAAAKNVTHVVSLIKDGPGLGFSMEGGNDSPQGDLPLTVKKIFQGGAAEKCGDLSLGDEILAINDISVINMTKIEVWNLMKKLPGGNVSIHIHR